MTALSPIAQAVWDEFNKPHPRINWFDDSEPTLSKLNRAHRFHLAAALCVVASQAVDELNTRNRIYAIAAELGALHDD